MSELTISMLIADRSASKDRREIIDGAYRLEAKRQKSIKKLGREFTLSPRQPGKSQAQDDLLQDHSELPMLLRKQAV